MSFSSSTNSGVDARNNNIKPRNGYFALSTLGSWDDIDSVRVCSNDGSSSNNTLCSSDFVLKNMVIDDAWGIGSVAHMQSVKELIVSPAWVDFCLICYK